MQLDGITVQVFSCIFAMCVLASEIDWYTVGDIEIYEGMRLTVNSDLDGANPQFTLTCISTGGPATTVTWTRDSDTVTEGTETVLNNQMIAQYTHTLTVTGRLGGLYTCTVSNNKPSEDEAQLFIKGNLRNYFTYITFQ